MLNKDFLSLFQGLASSIVNIGFKFISVCLMGKFHLINVKTQLRIFHFYLFLFSGQEEKVHEICARHVFLSYIPSTFDSQDNYIVTNCSLFGDV